MRPFDYYTGPGGRAVVEKEIREAKMTVEEAAILAEAVRRVERGDTLPGDIKQLRGPIWEIRTSGHKRDFRLLYAQAKASGSPIFLGLVFFSKKSQKTPKRCIELAETRLRDYWHRN